MISSFGNFIVSLTIFAVKVWKLALEFEIRASSRLLCSGLVLVAERRDEWRLGPLRRC